jgi:shikimate kinase
MDQHIRIRLRVLKVKANPLTHHYIIEVTDLQKKLFRVCLFASGVFRIIAMSVVEPSVTHSHNQSDSPVGKNLILVGFMGTGKTTLGRILARKLGFQFIDTDHLIEKKAGKSVTRIFEEDGEPAFRDMERQAVEEWLPRQGAVIACGGGLVMGQGMLDKLRQLGVVVCLFASPETILSRVSRNDQRPLLRAEDPLDRIKKLLRERLPVYMQAGCGILTDSRSELDIIKSILRIYRKRTRK